MAYRAPDSTPAPQRRMTVEEYLAFEIASPMKHEYVDGEIYEMSGVTRRHGRIVSNIMLRLLTVARGGPCQVIAVDVKVRVKDRFYYPDVFVVCTPGSDDDIIVPDPCMLIEVTSPSSARTDRTEKRDAYLTLPSLRAYLIVDHRTRRVDSHLRDESGAWRVEEVIGVGSVRVPCPDTELTLDDIYEGVELPAVREPDIPYETVPDDDA